MLATLAVLQDTLRMTDLKMTIRLLLKIFKSSNLIFIVSTIALISLTTTYLEMKPGE